MTEHFSHWSYYLGAQGSQCLPQPRGLLTGRLKQFPDRTAAFLLVFMFSRKTDSKISVVTHPIVEERIGFSKLKMRAVGCVGFCVFENVSIRIQND